VERGAALLLLPVLAAYAAKRRGLLPSLDRVTLGRKTPVPRRQLSGCCTRWESPARWSLTLPSAGASSTASSPIR